MIVVHDARYLSSAFFPHQFPPPDMPEYAFIGRSNAGKSSFINMLVRRHNLVKTSKEPGKTISLNFFLINRSFRFVDLPGYGYARRSKAQQRQWRLTIESYLTTRKCLRLVFLLIDGRHGPQESDEQMREFLEYHRIPYRCVFTKIDKLTNSRRGILRHQYPHVILASVTERKGFEETWACIEQSLA